jgi:hypothetical protein
MRMWSKLHNIITLILVLLCIDIGLHVLEILIDLHQSGVL